MRIVIDANVLFSALIKPGITRRILLFSDFELFAPEFSIIEFKKHFPELKDKTGLPTEELDRLLDKLIDSAGIMLVPFEDFKSKRTLAEEISPDTDDSAYFALALHLNCPIWSNDKALKKQEKVKIISTKELLKTE